MSLMKLCSKTTKKLISNKLIQPKAFCRNFKDVSFETVSDVSPSYLKKAFKTHNLTFEEGFTCFILKCMICTKTVDKKIDTDKIYINKTTGMFMCMYCKRTGQWNDLENFIKKDKSKERSDAIKAVERERLKESLREIRKNTYELNNISQEDLSDIIQNFKLPTLESDCMENLKIRMDNLKTKLYFPLENAESELVGYRTLGTNKIETILPNHTYGGLLTVKMPKKRESAIIVPTINEFLKLLNHKLNANMVCLPNSVHSLSPYFLPSLERFKKLILWFGYDSCDVASWEAARQFAKKLGEKRCSFIRPDGSNDLDKINDTEVIKSVIKGAQPLWHKSITTFSHLKEDVFRELQNVDKVQGVKWKRYPTLNKILRGHRRGELTVITGPTGSGKTTFISEYSLDLAMQNVNTLWGSFEIRNTRLARTMLQQMAMLPLEENLHRFDEFADEFEKLPIYFMTFHGQQTIKVVMEAVEHATYVHDIAHVIIDNLQFMMGMTEEAKHMDRFWKQDAIIAAFRSFATRKNCHVTLVIHPRKERDDEDLTTSSIFGGAKASQEADNVLIIQDKRLTSIKGKKYLQVVKNRYSGDLGIMALEFDKSSLSFAPKKSKKVNEEKILSEGQSDNITS